MLLRDKQQFPSKILFQKFCRYFVLTFLLLNSLIAIICWLQIKNTRLLMETTEVNKINLQKHLIEQRLEGVTRDLLVLASHQEMIDYLNSGNKKNLKTLEEEFLALSFAKQSYSQIRLLDQKGVEKIRVDFKKDGSISVHSSNSLSKKHRYYFKKIFQLKEYQFWVSPFDLNMENNKIERPIQPVIRIGMPLFDSKKQKKGVLLVNYLGVRVLEFLKSTKIYYQKTSLSKTTWMVNTQGFWLKGRRAEEEWGFMFPSKQNQNFAKDFPEIWKILKNRSQGFLHGKKGLFTYQSVFPFKDSQKLVLPIKSSFKTLQLNEKNYEWKLISFIPQKTWRKKIWLAIQYQIFLALFLNVLLGIVTLSFAVNRLRQKQMEEDLKKLSRAVEQSKNSVVITNQDGTIEFVNEAFIQTTGYNYLETLGKNSNLIKSGKMSKDFYLNLWDTIQKGRVWEGEIINKKKDGSCFWEYLTISPIRTENNIITHYVAIKRDITEFKQKEAEEKEKVFYNSSRQKDLLSISQKKFNTFEEALENILSTIQKSLSLEHAYVLFDEKTEISFLQKRIQSKEYSTYFRVEDFSKKTSQLEEFANKTHLISKNDLDDFPSTFQAPIWLRGQLIAILCLEEKRGKREWLVEEKEFIGNIASNISTRIESYERLLAETKLKKSLKILEKQNQWMMGREQRIIELKKMVNTFYENQGKTAIFQSILDEDEQDAIPEVYSLKDSNKIAFNLIEDIEQAKKEAEIANKIKSEFIANMSHEIRTPMNSVIGFTEILQKKIQNPEHLKYLSFVLSSGRALLELINDILDISKIEAGKLTLKHSPVNLKLFLQEIYQIFSQKMKEKNLEFIVHLEKEVPKYVLLDEVRLRQIFINLIGNAIKFTEKGLVQISIFAKESKEKDSGISLIMEIEDTGIGIPKEKWQLIFEPFEQHRVKGESKNVGTGLGLAITKRLVSLMDGTISIVDKKSSGTKFHIHLPNIRIDLNPKIVEPKIDFQSIVFEKKVALVVDDIKIHRDLLKNILEEFNFRIIEAKNGKEAIQLVEKEAPDIILMDIKMQGLDGFETTRILRNLPNFNTPVIAVTASQINHKENKHKDLFDVFLIRPFMIQELLEILMKFLPFHIKKEEIITSSKSMKDYSTALSISEKNKAHLPKILELLKKELHGSWENIRNRVEIQESKKFAETIQNIGKEYSIPSLEIWGTNLLEDVMTFHRSKIQETMETFPDLVDSFQNILNS